MKIKYEGRGGERERESEILNSITMPMKLSHACLLIISDDITLRVSTVITHWVGPKRGHILRVVAVPCALCPGSCRHAPLGVGTTHPAQNMLAQPTQHANYIFCGRNLAGLTYHQGSECLWALISIFMQPQQQQKQQQQ